MQFVIESIKKQIQFWNSNLNLQNSFSLEMKIIPFDDWRLDIGKDYIFCSEQYFESHQLFIGDRKNITGFLHIHNYDELSTESKKELSDSFGYALHHGEMIMYTVFMKEKLFHDVLNQLNFTKDVRLLINLDEENVEKERVVISEGFDGKHSLWKVDSNSSSNSLNIQNFSLGFQIL